MDTVYLIGAIIGTVLIGIAWKRAVLAAGIDGDGSGGGTKRAIPSAVLAGALMIAGFLTLQLFARHLAVWFGYAHHPFGG